jgi:hypothetical protein
MSFRRILDLREQADALIEPDCGRVPGNGRLASNPETLSLCEWLLKRRKNSTA